MRRPASRRRRAWSTSLRTSATPTVTALKAKNSASSSRASTRARVVLPQPGGPQKIMDANKRRARMARQRMRPSPTRWPWPANSVRSRGRIRAARGSGGANREGVLGFTSETREKIFLWGEGQGSTDPWPPPPKQLKPSHHTKRRRRGVNRNTRMTMIAQAQGKI